MWQEKSIGKRIVYFYGSQRVLFSRLNFAETRIFMKVDKSLFIRVDANTQTGTGHLMRCLALAHGWKNRGGESTFITACDSNELLLQLSHKGFKVIALESTFPDPTDWEDTAKILDGHPNTWVVLDGYHFDTTYQNRIKEAGHKLLLIDDIAHLKHYCADVILNQNINAERIMYSCDTTTQKLLGTYFALLRPEFLAFKGWKRNIPSIARKVMVMLGGGGTLKRLLKIIEAVQQADLQEMEVIVVVGAGMSGVGELAASISNSQSIRFVCNPPNMAELMAWADIAVSASGSTCWELAFMGLSAILVVTSENQVNVANGLEQAGVAKNLGEFTDENVNKISKYLQMLAEDNECRLKMSKLGRKLVDGRGIERVYAALENEGLYLRLVDSEDCCLLWKWANDPECRRMAINQEPIAFEEHTKWFKNRLLSDDTLILILEKNSIAIGQIRFDRNHSDEAEIDIYVEKGYRGLSLGTYLLREGTQYYLNYLSLNRRYVKTVVGHIRPENDISCRAFEKAGFRRKDSKRIKDADLLSFTMEGNIN